jgi:hypothetical protein
VVDTVDCAVVRERRVNKTLEVESFILRSGEGCIQYGDQGTGDR